MITAMQAAIFDLDGVIVDTAKYHYLAWKRLADAHGFDFTERDNEQMKGVSRARSLEILLEKGGLQVDEPARQAMAAQKNAWYVEFISRLDESEILPGVTDYIGWIRGRGIKTGLASASKNAGLILERLNIRSMFDVVVDGSMVRRSKPDPEAFLLAAAQLGIERGRCVVFEDAEAGIEAARRAGMGVVGIGRPDQLKDADMVIAGLYQLVALLPDRATAA